jgi:hypothetical protein
MKETLQSEIELLHNCQLNRKLKVYLIHYGTTCLIRVVVLPWGFCIQAAYWLVSLIQ